MSKTYEAGGENKENRVLTIKDLYESAREKGTKISEYHIRMLVIQGLIPSRRIGNKFLVPEEGFWAYLRCQSPPSEAEGAVANKKSGEVSKYHGLTAQ